MLFKLTLAFLSATVDRVELLSEELIARSKPLFLAPRGSQRGASVFLAAGGLVLARSRVGTLIGLLLEQSLSVFVK